MKVLLPFSGGLDSTAALFLLIENGHSVKPLTLDYGQKCGIEIERAAQLARFVGTQIATETLLTKFPKCSRVNEELDLPVCHSESDAAAECAVPGLYAQIIASALRHALLEGCEAICLPFTVAASQFYPEFDETGWRLSSAFIKHTSTHSIKTILPFSTSSKLTLLRMLSASGAPYWLTHSCLRNVDDCGTCPKCAIRNSLFGAARSKSGAHYE